MPQLPRACVSVARSVNTAHRPRVAVTGAPRVRQPARLGALPVRAWPTKYGMNQSMPGTPLRLASYNLLEGLRPIGSGPGERRQLDRERAEAARRVVEELSPEILVLNEALFCRQYRGHV